MKYKHILWDAKDIQNALGKLASILVGLEYTNSKELYAGEGALSSALVKGLEKMLTDDEIMDANGDETYFGDQMSVLRPSLEFLDRFNALPQPEQIFLLNLVGRFGGHFVLLEVERREDSIETHGCFIPERFKIAPMSKEKDGKDCLFIDFVGIGLTHSCMARHEYAVDIDDLGLSYNAEDNSYSFNLKRKHHEGSFRTKVKLLEKVYPKHMESFFKDEKKVALLYEPDFIFGGGGGYRLLLNSHGWALQNYSFGDEVLPYIIFVEREGTIEENYNDAAKWLVESRFMEEVAPFAEAKFEKPEN